MAAVKRTVVEIASSSDGLSVLSAVAKAAALWRDANDKNDMYQHVMNSAINSHDYVVANHTHIHVHAEFRAAVYALIESLKDVQP